MRLFALAILAAGLAGAASSQAQITTRGSDSTLHVIKALAEQFEKDSGKSVKIEGGGSGAGAKAAIAGEVQLAFLSRELTSAEKEAGLIGVPYAIDGVAVIVNRANPEQDIALADLKSLFTGTTESWKDGKPAVVFNRNADSGTREVFQELVLGKGVKFSDKAAIKHDGIILGAVSKIATSAAYTSLSEADESLVKILTINGIKPTADTLRNKSYPISRIPTLATKGEPSADTKAFIDFVTGPKGQAIVEAQKLIKIK